MKEISIIKKFSRIKNEEFLTSNSKPEFFEIVDIEMVFFGKKMVNTYDTRVFKDGRREVIDGDGFIKAGTDISHL